MKYLQGKYPVINKQALAHDVYSILILCPEVAKLAQAGQFVHILPTGFGLRRPISIAGIDKKNGVLRIVFVIKGNGTKAIADLKQGDFIDMIAPLGHGFTLMPEAEHVVLVGGGIGVPPMLPLAEYYGEKATAISGFRSFQQVILQEDLENYGAKTICCTEDGSAGAVKGFVTTPLEQLLTESVDAVFACGALPMLKAVAELCKRNKIYCEVSMEERMACGVGACLGCACEIKNADGEINFLHVCKNGPVFNAEEVCW
ncbi:MAG: dihydroorotate dehydrogenase electron transfer subunit [Oscillospiraceae bacterium]|nr:dihydroorotate dehydrogenase electron transfer subunit [Oscillospiraceae bacterium]